MVYYFMHKGTVTISPCYMVWPKMLVGNLIWQIGRCYKYFSKWYAATLSTPTHANITASLVHQQKSVNPQVRGKFYTNPPSLISANN